jgi:hypothetical protein
MTNIQVVLAALILLNVIRIYWRFRNGGITRRSFLWWLFLWACAFVVVIRPEGINRVADFLGVGRGADVVLYLALVLVFFLLFKLFSRTVKLEGDIEKIVRALALRDDERNKR